MIQAYCHKIWFDVVNLTTIPYTKNKTFFSSIEDTNMVLAYYHLGYNASKNSTKFMTHALISCSLGRLSLCIGACADIHFFKWAHDYEDIEIRNIKIMLLRARFCKLIMIQCHFKVHPIHYVAIVLVSKHFFALNALLCP